MHTLLVPSGKEPADPEALPDQLIKLLAGPDALVWLDIEAPTDEDAALLSDVFGFHPLAIEDAVRARERPKVDIYHAYPALAADGEHPPQSTKAATDRDVALPGPYYLVVFYSVHFNSQDHVREVNPITMFVGTHYLVTVHPQPIAQLTQTWVRFQAPKSPMEHRSAVLAYSLLDAIVDDYFPLIDQVAEEVEELEDAIFAEPGEETIQEIFVLKKQLLRLRQVFAPERDVVNVLLRRELPVFKSRDVAYLQDIYDHLVRLTDGLDTYRDLVSTALDSYLSIQSNNLNQIMKTLTIGSILLMAAALIAGIYGMNFRYMPELAQRWGYPFSLLLMLAVSGGLALYFKSKDWF
jgi:magnesium transporter